MRKKTIIAVLTACMMLIAATPTLSWATSCKNPVLNKNAAALGIEEDYHEAARQYMLDALDAAYGEYIKDRSYYDSAVWQEIQAVYKEGRLVYSQIAIEEFLSEDTSDYGAILGELGELKKGSKLSEVKKNYLKAINSELRYYKQYDYSDYYWDQIQDCLYMGKQQLNSAETFRDAAEGYLRAMMGMEYACNKEEIAESRSEYISQINQYVNLGLDPSKYTTAEWQRVKEIQAQAIRDLSAAELEEEMEEISAAAGEDFYAVTGVGYPLEGRTIVDELIEKLETFYYALDEAQYSDEMAERLDEICWEAEEGLYYAETRQQAQEIYDTAIAAMKDVPTKKEEITAIQKAEPKLKAVKAKSSTSVAVSWKKVSGVTGYTVYRAASATGKYKKVKAVKGTSLTDTGLKLGKTYYYKVRAYKTLDKKNYYSKYSAAVKGVPMLAKTKLTLSRSGSSAVQLKWKTVNDAKGYEIYRAASYNGQYSKIKILNGEKQSSWKDTSAKKGQKYYYKIRSYCKVKGETRYSPYSSVKSIRL